MPLDILAIQYIYGANLSWHIGDDLWTLANDGAVRTIWDAGGDDTLSAAALGVGVTLDLRQGELSSIGAMTRVATAYGEAALIENAIGGSGNDKLTGNHVANRLEGRAGNDTLDGGDADLAADTLAGGPGNDEYRIRPSDIALENPGEGVDTWVESVGSASFTVPENFENARLQGWNMQVIGNPAPNRLTVSAGGQDTLRGLAGNDTLEGGAGDDIYYVEQTGDVVIEAANNGTDKVIFLAAGDYALGANVERMDFYGHGFMATGNGANNLIAGNPGGNLILGGAGNDTLSGGRGEDTLDGGAGNDRLDGGRGIDLMQGGAGNDTYVVDGRKDSIVEAAGAGTDTVQVYGSRYELPANVENAVVLAAGRTGITGNALANQIAGGAGNDTLAGGAGADRFVFNQEPGSTNVDRLTDFATGADRIVLDGDVFTALGSAVDPAEFLASSDGSGAAGVRLIYNSTSGALYYDVDDAGPGEAVLFAVLGTRGARPDLDAGDFLVVS